jgi:hypothetical protein
METFTLGPLNLIVHQSVLPPDMTLLDTAKAGACMAFNLDGMVNPIGLVKVRTAPGDLGKEMIGAMPDGAYALFATKFVGTFEEAQEQKDAFSWVLRTIARDCKSTELVFVSESWWADDDCFKHYKQPGDTMEQCRARMPASLGACTGAKEGVIITHEHINGRHAVWFAEITTSADGVRKLEEFKDMSVDEASGRMASFLTADTA